MRALFLMLTLLGASGCTGLFFFPSRALVLSPSDLGLAYERKVIADGSHTLHGWYLPAQGKTHGTVLFLHGNAENITTHLLQVYWLPQQGYQLYLFDYSGYGESDGKLDITTIHSDVEQMVRFVVQEQKSGEGPLFLMGQSLGATIALYTAAEPEFQHTFQAIVVDSPFSSYRLIAREKVALTWLTGLLQWPLGFLVSDDFSPHHNVAQISVPTLYLHGDKDSTVPPSHSETLCQLEWICCTRIVVPGAAHGDPLTTTEGRHAVLEFMEHSRCLSDRPRLLEQSCSIRGKPAWDDVSGA